MNYSLSDQTHEPLSRSAEWANAEELPTPKDLPSVPGWYILVRPQSIQEKTKGGIILTTRSKDDVEQFTNIGEVVKVGDLAYKDERFANGAWCKTGDHVLFQRHAGQRIKWKGVKFILLADDKVILAFDNPKDVDVKEDIADSTDF